MNISSGHRIPYTKELKFAFGIRADQLRATFNQGEIINFSAIGRMFFEMKIKSGQRFGAILNHNLINCE